MNVRHPLSVLYSFSIKNIFNDKMDLGLYFHVTKGILKKRPPNWSQRS